MKESGIDIRPSSFGESDESPLGFFPYRFLGLGLLIVWDWCLHDPDTLTLGTVKMTNIWQLSLGIAVGSILVFVILALAVRRVTAVSRHHLLLVTALIAALAGSGAELAVANGVLPNSAVVEWVAGLPIGYGTGVLTLYWAEVYSRLESKRVFLYGALSLVLSGFLVFIVSSLTQPAKASCVLVAPALSFLLCYKSSDYVGHEPVETRRNVRYTFPWKPVIIMAFCGFAATFVTVAIFTQGTLPHILADFCIGTIVALTLLIARSKVNPALLMGIALGAIGLGLALLAIIGTGGGFPAAFLTMLSYVSISFFTFALLANLSRRYSIPSLWLFGFAAAAREIMSHVGGFSNQFFPALDEMAGSHLQLAVASAVGLLAIGVLAILWTSERSFDSNWAIDTIDIRTGRRIPSAHEILIEKCEKAASAYGLTEREGDIMQLLAENKTYQEICAGLFLSMSTVKTHAHHVYAKLDVHTREEMLEKIQCQ